LEGHCKLQIRSDLTLSDWTPNVLILQAKTLMQAQPLQAQPLQAQPLLLIASSYYAAIYLFSSNPSPQTLSPSYHPSAP